MAKEETSNKGGLTVEQRREYERRMEMENKRREIDEEEVFRGPTPKQKREYERRLEAKNKRLEERRNEREEDRRNERVEDRGNEEEQETTFRFPILDTSIILGEEVK